MNCIKCKSVFKEAVFCNSCYQEARKDGQVLALQEMLLWDCPVKYYNGTKGNAVPIERIEGRLLELEK